MQPSDTARWDKLIPINDNFQISVNVKKEVRSAKTGKLLRTEKTHNLFVDAGLNVLRDFLGGNGVTGLERFAIGTGTTAVTASDTLLDNEVFRDALTQKVSTLKTLTVKYFLASGSANGNTITEAGMFANGATDTANSGTLCARVLFTADAKTSSEAWNFNWTFTFSAS